MTAEGEGSLIGMDIPQPLSDRDVGRSGLFCDDIDLGCTGIKGILDRFFDDRGRSFDNFTGRYFVYQHTVQLFDRASDLFLVNLIVFYISFNSARISSAFSGVRLSTSGSVFGVQFRRSVRRWGIKQGRLIQPHMNTLCQFRLGELSRFKKAKDFPGPSNRFFGTPANRATSIPYESSHPPPRDLVQKHDFLSPLFDRDLKILNTGINCGQAGHFMIMGGEQRPRRA